MKPAVNIPHKQKTVKLLGWGFAVFFAYNMVEDNRNYKSITICALCKITEYG